MLLNPYLMFDGQREEAFKFYEKCFGGKIIFMMRYEASPVASQTPPEVGKRILHAGLAVGDGVALEGSDAMPGQYKKQQIFAVMLRPHDSSEAERIFKALAEEGTVQIPMEETFWAVRFGKVTDRFGVPWLINCEKPAA
ncbi:MAG TPA: VOC family protein [Bryobacteraceae bacterium]